MSSSTVSVNANPPASTRRRAAVEMKTPATTTFDLADSVLALAATSPSVLAAVDVTPLPKDPTRHVIRNAIPRRDAAATKKSAAGRDGNPRWLTALKVFSKNFLILLALVGLAQILRRMISNSNSRVNRVDAISSEFEVRIAGVEALVKNTLKMMQVQVDIVDKKIELGIQDARNEISKKIEEKSHEFESKLKDFDVKNRILERLIGEMGSKKWLSKEEFDGLLEEFQKAKTGDSEVGLDEVRDFVRELVEREMARHAADGLGRVDYAMASGGGRVVKHSEAFVAGKGRIGNWMLPNNWNRIHVDAEKMLRPSFGEPGQCFPLKGSSGFVQIRLRAAVIPEAVTLEHVDKGVAYDRSSAPKECRVSGWLHRKDLANGEKRLLLAEFTYDLERTNAQTFKVTDSASSGVVDTIRLDFRSNYGSPHTCIYRLRVHGHEPKASMLGKS